MMKLSAKKLFLIDGIGALLSVFFLALVLPKFELYFGMPKNTLFILACIAAFFAINSLTIFLFTTKNLQLYLKAIAIANIAYCVYSLVVVVNNYTTLTKLGMVYFIVEIAVILLLALVEIKVATIKQVK